LLWWREVRLNAEKKRPGPMKKKTQAPFSQKDQCLVGKKEGRGIKKTMEKKYQFPGKEGKTTFKPNGKGAGGSLGGKNGGNDGGAGEGEGLAKQ